MERIINPGKYAFPKVYEVETESPLKGKEEVELFASGKMMLRSEKKACKPAKLEIIDSGSVSSSNGNINNIEEKDKGKPRNFIRYLFN